MNFSADLSKSTTSSIFQGYISEAKVAIYEKHKRDLKTLKKYIKIYMPEKKAEIFNISSKDNNYVAYSKHIKAANA